MPCRRSAGGVVGQDDDRASSSPTATMTTTSAADSCAPVASPRASLSPRRGARLRPGPHPLGGRARRRLAARLQATPDPLRTPSRHPPRPTPTGLRTHLLPPSAAVLKRLLKVTPP